MKSIRSSSWWIVPIIGILTALVLLFLAVRSLSGHEAPSPDPTSRFTAKRAGEMGYGLTWGPRENRQSIVVWGSGSTAEIQFESYGPPTNSFGARGPTKQLSDFPPAAVELLLERLAGDP